MALSCVHHRTAQALAVIVLTVGSSASAQSLTPPNAHAGGSQWAYPAHHSQILSGGQYIDAVRLVATAEAVSPSGVPQRIMRMRLESPSGAVFLIGTLSSGTISWVEPGVFLTGTPPAASGSAQQIDATYLFDFGNIDGEWKVNFYNDHWSGQVRWNDIEVIPIQMQVGACCMPDGGCEEILEGDCINAGGVFRGDHTECATIPPCTPGGACCHSAGPCTLTNSALCAAAGGTFHGAGTDCATICPTPTNTLWPPNASDLASQQWAYNPDHSQVLSGGQDVNAVRLVASALQTSTLQTAMRMRLESPSGVVLLIGAGAEIAWNEPGVLLTGTPPQASVVGAEIDATYAFDFGGIDGEWKVNFLHAGFSGFLTWNDIQVILVQHGVGACCLPDGGCEEMIETQCSNAGGVFSGENSECATVPPCPLPGACCLSTGGCMLTNSGLCAAAGGTFSGPGTDCATICPPPTDMLLPPNAHPESQQWAYAVDYSQMLSGGQDINAVRLVATAEPSVGGAWQTDMRMRLESPSGATLLIGSGAGWYQSGVLLTGTPPAGTANAGEIDATYLYDFGNIDGEWKVNFFLGDPSFSRQLRWNDIQVIPVALETGACCLPDGGCEEVLEVQCANAGGVYNGHNTECAAIPPCPQPPIEIIVPSAQANSPGNSNNGAPFGSTTASQRYQQVYGATDLGLLSGPHELREIRFRPNNTSSFDPWSNQFTLELSLSTTQLGPDTLTTVFEDNHGADRMIAYSGEATISTAQSGPSSAPLDFDLVIELQTPFAYDPALGHLLMDIRRTGHTLPAFRVLDAHNEVGDAVSRMWADNSNALTGTFGTTPSLGLITKFVFAAPLETGACCKPGGGCEVISERECADAGGVYSGDNTECATIPPCPQPPIEIIVPSAQANSPGGSNNSLPFGVPFPSHRYQQVYGATDFGLLSGPHELTEIRFRPDNGSTFSPWSNEITLELIFSTTQFGPDMLTSVFEDNHGADRKIVYSGPATISTAQSGPSSTPLDFDIVIELQTPFTYDPVLGHLLMDVRRDGHTISLARFLDAQNEVGDAVSRMWANSSTALTGSGFTTPSLGLVTKFVFEPGTDVCYANCDNSTIEPILNVDDFTCFINEFAAAQSLPHEEQITHYANCDGSTIAPVLNVDDFTCFINAFAQGCP